MSKLVAVVSFALAVVGGLWAAAWMIVSLASLVAPEEIVLMVLLVGSVLGLLECFLFRILAQLFIALLA